MGKFLNKTKATIVSIAVMCLLCSCEHETYRMSIVIPDKYQGLFYVRRQSDGVQIRKGGGGEYTLHIPVDGTLNMKNTEIFDKWHELHVYYANGDEIEVETVGVYPNDERLRVWHLSVDHTGKHTFFVGKGSEARLVEQ